MKEEGHIEKHFKSRFPQRLFSRLDALGISKKELADKLGISQQTMSHYASGKSIPKVTLIRHMARILQCDAGWLACFYVRKNNPDIFEEEDIKDDHPEELSGWNVKPEGGWTEETLPPKRGQDGSNPYSYMMVVEYKQSRASTEVGEKVDIRVQGIGWLNDVWEDKKGFIMYAQQLSNTKLAYVHDKPVAFRYSQLIAWKDIDKYIEREK